jgi:hypothetical protein
MLYMEGFYFQFSNTNAFLLIQVAHDMERRTHEIDSFHKGLADRLEPILNMRTLISIIPEDLDWMDVREGTQIEFSLIPSDFTRTSKASRHLGGLHIVIELPGSTGKTGWSVWAAWTETWLVTRKKGKIPYCAPVSFGWTFFYGERR